MRFLEYCDVVGMAGTGVSLASADAGAPFWGFWGVCAGALVVSRAYRRAVGE